MGGITLEIRKEINEITVQKGQTLTVCLIDEREKYKPNRYILKSVLVELRVRDDGTPEIFADKNKIQLKDWTEWEPSKD